MAHFAKIGLNNVVTDVLVVANRETMDSNGVEHESIGVEFLKNLTGHETWIQTSYNTRGGIHYVPDSTEPSADQSKALRANYAGIGYTYDQANDVFYAPRPYASWTISAPTWIWQAPVPYPTDGKMYTWDEATTSWVEVTTP